MDTTPSLSLFLPSMHRSRNTNEVSANVRSYTLYPVYFRYLGTGKVKKMNNIKLAENTLGQRIKAQRIRVGYTQEQLAEIMCVPKSTISAYENDKVDIKGSVIAELARHLATKPDYLLGFETEEDPYVITAAAILQGIKDEKIKALLLGQLQLAGKMGM